MKRRAWTGRGIRERRVGSVREKTSWKVRVGGRPREWERCVNVVGLFSGREGKKGLISWLAGKGLELES